MSWRYGKHTTRPFLRRGLRLIAVASAITICYCAEKVVYVGARQLGLDPWPPQVQEQLSPTIGGPGGILLIGGIVLPAVGPQAVALSHYVWLRPLWLLLYSAAPEIKFALRSWQSEVLLLRRVAGIRDGIWKVRPYLALATAQRAQRSARDAGEVGDELAATVTAAVIVDGVRAKARGQFADVVHPMDSKGGADLDAEAAWLLQVTRKLRSPAARNVVAFGQASAGGDEGRGHRRSQPDDAVA